MEVLSMAQDAPKWMHEIGGSLDTCHPLHVQADPRQALNVILAPSGFWLPGHPDYIEGVQDDTDLWKDTVVKIYDFAIKHRPYDPRENIFLNLLLRESRPPGGPKRLLQLLARRAAVERAARVLRVQRANEEVAIRGQVVPADRSARRERAVPSGQG
ncbi:unnamed protein product [Amoebophrya sp. A120]|nr:unnamed protein product [Amoebophrya sp. A120]|eukprot:GSA120T00007211001.1